MQEILLAIALSVSPLDSPAQNVQLDVDKSSKEFAVQHEIALVVDRYHGTNSRYRELLKQREAARLHMNLKENGAEARFRLLDNQANAYRDQLFAMEAQLRALNTKMLSLRGVD